MDSQKNVYQCVSVGLSDWSVCLSICISIYLFFYLELWKPHVVIDQNGCITPKFTRLMQINTRLQIIMVNVLAQNRNIHQNLDNFPVVARKLEVRNLF